MVNELGCCNAGVERACHDGEGHRADAWEKLGKETGKQQAFIRELEHHGKIVKCNGRKNFVLWKENRRNFSVLYRILESIRWTLVSV
jgi:hypothetical protein